MNTIWDIPIEPLEERYSKQWADWFQRHYAVEARIDHVVVEGFPLTTKIETGAFLDVHGTNYYKASQLQVLIRALYEKKIKSGDWIFFHDLWFPGIEMLAYIRDASGVNFKIAGCLHAGSWDENDFIKQKGMAPWAHLFERSLFVIADKVFVATQYHKELICSDQMYETAKVHVTGFPIYPDDFLEPRAPDANDHPVIVFPHRLDPEKNPHLFLRLSKDKRFEQWEFVTAKTSCKTKKKYYQLLARADYAVSFSDQETWGIAMQEAAFSGCITFVPARLSYREMYAPALQYADMDDLINKLVMCEASSVHKRFFQNAQSETNHKLVLAGALAIPHMLRIMGF